MASAAARLLLLVVAGVLLRPAVAEIKHEFFKEDSRQSLLFEKFGFSRRGSVSIAVSGASAASKLAEPDPTQLGFFLLSNEGLFKAINDQPPPIDMDTNPACVLSSPYVIPLFTFADLDSSGSYNRTFPVTRADQYRLFFANCAPETAVTMEVRTDLYNNNLDGTKNYLSVGSSKKRTFPVSSSPVGPVRNEDNAKELHMFYFLWKYFL